MNYPRNAIQQAKVILENMNDDLELVHVTKEEFSTMIEDAEAQAGTAQKLLEAKKEAIKRRNDEILKVWDTAKRIRNAAKAQFGDNAEIVQKMHGKE